MYLSTTYRVSSLAGEEKLLKKKKEIMYNQRLLNMRIKKYFFGEELRKTYKAGLQMLLIFETVQKRSNEIPYNLE